MDTAIVEVVRVDPTTVEKNPLPRNIEDIVAVDVTREEPVSVL